MKTYRTHFTPPRRSAPAHSGPPRAPRAEWIEPLPNLNLMARLASYRLQMDVVLRHTREPLRGVDFQHQTEGTRIRVRCSRNGTLLLGALHGTQTHLTLAIGRDGHVAHFLDHGPVFRALHALASQMGNLHPPRNIMQDTLTPDAFTPDTSTTTAATAPLSIPYEDELLDGFSRAVGLQIQLWVVLSGMEQLCERDLDGIGSAVETLAVSCEDAACAPDGSVQLDRDVLRRVLHSVLTDAAF